MLEAEATFESLVAALTTAPVLQLPDFIKTFTVDCDAFGAGFRVVLHKVEAQLPSSVVRYRHTMRSLPHMRELIRLMKAV
jgi:hypothetical protein